MKHFSWLFLYVVSSFFVLSSHLCGQNLSHCRFDQSEPNFNDNPYVTDYVQNLMEPYLLPLDHPTRKFLDSICLKTRVIKDKKTFDRAGFKVISHRPRSHILVASHRRMPGYLIKVVLDTELRDKRGTKSWRWFVRRCQGAEKIRSIIQERRMKHFVIADKWIYCLPYHPSPPNDSYHQRHLAILVVTDMHLVPEGENLDAWRHEITKDHLDELYEIISGGNGSSYRADNINYTYEGTFAFIDTEYPTTRPDFKSIRPFLNSKMRKYWDYLVKRGGHSS